MIGSRLRRLRAALAALAALVSLAACAAEDMPRAEFLGRADWPASRFDMGGFSGLEVLSDGIRFTTVSDRGWLIHGRLIRENGQLVGIEPDAPQPLRDAQGQVLTGKATDAEGLARGDDGQMFVSFEGLHRVWAYPTTDAAVPLPSLPQFSQLQDNSGLEALAIDGRGRLVTLPERSGQLISPFPVWRYDEGVWSQPFALSRRGGFLPVGADFGPDGRFYLLEREFIGLGFRSRVRRFTLAEDRILSEETLLETSTHRHGNLEGLAVWRDQTGAIRLTMMADDNFNDFQRSEVVEYRVSG